MSPLFAHRSRVPAEVRRLGVPPQRAHIGGFRVPEQRQVRKSPATQTTRATNGVLSVQEVSPTLTIDSFFPPQTEKAATDYQLSADRKFVAFMSNYSKVSQAFIPIDPHGFRPAAS